MDYFIFYTDDVAVSIQRNDVNFFETEYALKTTRSFLTYWRKVGAV